jgi:hypothetical protein
VANVRARSVAYPNSSALLTIRRIGDARQPHLEVRRSKRVDQERPSSFRLSVQVRRRVGCESVERCGHGAVRNAHRQRNALPDWAGRLFRRDSFR